MIKNIVAPIIIIFVVVGFIVTSVSSSREEKNLTGSVAFSEPVTIFKSPSCGCCGNYTAYLKDQGITVEVKEVEDMDRIKSQYKVPKTLESCHTVLVGGYVVEGHMPVQAIKKLLFEKPAIAGIALAGMPPGSPGMGGAKLAPFYVHRITLEGNDGGIFTEL